MGVNLEDQTSDKLLINGTYTGNAALSLTNLATSANETTGTGIKLVDFAGDNTGGGTFSLLGGQWDEGGYVYKLFQDSSDPDYYLRSTQELSDTYKTMLNVPLLNAVIARTGMNSLNKRLGDISLNKGKTGLWLRSYYKDMTVDDLIKTDMSLFGVEAGYDWLFNPNDPTKLYAGIMVGYMQANSIKTKNSNSDNNNGKGDSPSVGVYVTIANEDNWFIDLAARNFWTKVENTTRTSSNNLLNYDVKRNMLAASFEVGKNIATEVDLKLQPKVEISYMKAGKDSSPVTNGVGDLTYDSATYISGKAAILFAYKAEFGNSLIFEPLLELAYNHEFDGEGLVSYGGATEKTSLKGGSGEIIAGFNMQLADNLYWHAIGSYEKGSKISGWGVNAGIRVGFGGNDSGSKKSYKNKKKYQSNPYRYYKTYR